MGYYLHNEVHVTNGECGSDGRRELMVRVVLHYDAPADGLPHYVTGAATDRANTLRTNVLVFAPVGGGLVSETQRDGAPVAIDRGEDHSREVGSVTVELLPGGVDAADLHRARPAECRWRHGRRAARTWC